MKKVKYIIILITLITLTSCFGYKTEKIYPETLVIENYGTLKYEKTILEGCNVTSTEIVNNNLWTLVKEHYDNDFFYYYNLSTDQYQIIELQGDFTSSLYQLDNNLIFVVKYTDIVGDDTYYSNKICMIDKNNLTKKLIEPPYQEDYLNIVVSESTNEVYIHYLDSGKIFKSIDNCMTWTTANFDDYKNASSKNDEIIIDSKNRMYKFIYGDPYNTDVDLEVSVDSGDKWNSMFLGTNDGNEICVIEDNVYISSNQYRNVLFIMPLSAAGGGLHIMKWYYF